MQILIFDIELYHIKVYMVAGGWYRPNLNVSAEYLDSVEFFVLGHSAWQQAESLPIEINGPGAAVIDNVPYFFGNENLMSISMLSYVNVGGGAFSPEMQDFILKFNSTTSSLEQVGTMTTARSHFGISTLTNDVVENLIQYCL